MEAGVSDHVWDLEEVIALLPRGDYSVGLEALTNRIRERLAAAKFCSVFENELEQVWPTDNALREKRVALIQAYAKKNGWSATVTDPGMRVTFRKLS